jgi:tRNA pseudouridine55 synthase
MTRERPPRPGLDGVLIVNKPAGPTSHDVVALARRALDSASVGHTGTLDPAATGVLPLVVGCATRLARFLSAHDKEYVAIVRFGRATDTFDAAGTVTSESGLVPDREGLEAALAAFRGPFAQTPPPYSAKKVAGVRAYRLARNERPVRPEPVIVTVDSIEIVSLEGALAEIRVVCSAGFYVRSLAHDLGERLGTGAVLEGLVRRRAGPFALAEAVPMERLDRANREELAGRVIPPAKLLPELGAVTVRASGVKRVLHGQDVGPADLEGSRALRPDELVRLLAPDGRLLALARATPAPGVLHPSVVLG